MPKQEKWEKVYEEYKKKDNISIEELEENWKEKDNEYKIKLSRILDSNSEEYKEVNKERQKEKREFNNKKKTISKFSGIKKNEAKIEKTKEHRDIHQELLDEILSFRAENQKREKDIAKLEKEAIELEKELEELKDIENALNYALKNPIATEEQREEVSKRLQINLEKQNENQSKFSKNQRALQEKISTPIKEYLEEDIDYLKGIIEKDNKICELLVEGKTMAEVQQSLRETKQTTTEQQEKEDEPKTTIVEPKQPQKSTAKTQKQPATANSDTKEDLTAELEDIIKNIDDEDEFKDLSEEIIRQLEEINKDKGNSKEVDSKKYLATPEKPIIITFDAKKGTYFILTYKPNGIQFEHKEILLKDILAREDFAEFYDKHKTGFDPYIAYIIKDLGIENADEIIKAYTNAVKTDLYDDKNLQSLDIEYNMDGIYGRRYNSELSGDIMCYANECQENGIAAVNKGFITRFLEKHDTIRGIWEKVSKIGKEPALLSTGELSKDNKDKKQGVRNFNTIFEEEQIQEIGKKFRESSSKEELNSLRLKYTEQVISKEQVEYINDIIREKQKEFESKIDNDDKNKFRVKNRVEIPLVKQAEFSENLKKHTESTVEPKSTELDREDAEIKD